MGAKISMMAGVGRQVRVVANAFHEPCPPPRPAGGLSARNFPAPATAAWWSIASWHLVVSTAKFAFLGTNKSQIQFAGFTRSSAARTHRARWGVTGYENPRQWCNWRGAWL